MMKKAVVVLAIVLLATTCFASNTLEGTLTKFVLQCVRNGHRAERQGIALKIVQTAFTTKIREAGFSKGTTEQIVKLCRHGCEFGYVSSQKGLSLPKTINNAKKILKK